MQLEVTLEGFFRAILNLKHFVYIHSIGFSFKSTSDLAIYYNTNAMTVKSLDGSLLAKLYQ